MFDINSFMARRRLKQRDVAKMLGCSMGIVASWCVGRKLPSYKYIEAFIRNGMTMTELFGEEIAELISQNSNSSLLKNEDFKEGMKEMMEEILREKFSGSPKKGKIK